jgi:hypothetical protein
MKIYEFWPNNWDYQFIVLAETPQEALDFLKEELKNNTEYDLYEDWKDVILDKLPELYVIKEYEKGKVIINEIN